MSKELESHSQAVAIVGMAGRFPGAETISEFWRLLEQGVDARSFPTKEEMGAAGLPREVYEHPDFVPTVYSLEKPERFDAAFFGISPGQAARLDPQQRIFLEIAWQALEDGGFAPGREEQVGVYAGAGAALYAGDGGLTPNLDVDVMSTFVNGAPDFLATRSAYRLGLRGPALTVQTACSTSLVAIHLACQAVLNGECELALAGGAALYRPGEFGYFYREGGIESRDGLCRAFDADAGGTINASGAAAVLLRPLKDALAEGSHIYAVIRGSALNNDGGDRAGFTAPGPEGQARVIVEALGMAGVTPASIGYIETHGTGTKLGDPIELSALKEAFRFGGGAPRGTCAIGSVKTNVGHLGAAAGVTSLIKTALSLQKQKIPASLNFQTANPALGLEESPFYVNQALKTWESAGPRRAGVSSFGFGGTNAHVILEEVPPLEAVPGKEEFQPLILSAKTPEALERATDQLAQRLKDDPGLSLKDAAYTLMEGRRLFDFRRVVVCENLKEAARALSERDPFRLLNYSVQSGSPPETPVFFIFPGQGAQYAGMGRALYESGPVFRRELDLCAKILEEQEGIQLLSLLYSDPEGDEHLRKTSLTQPALFAIEWSLAKQLAAWGITPVAMLGHSVGEYTAAALAQVFTLEEGLRLTAARGRLMESMPAGCMTALPLSEAEIRPLLNEELSLAALNAEGSCVVSGPEPAIEALEMQLAKKEIQGRRLVTSHAFHSAMMEPILEPFRRILKKINLKEPRLPFVSNLSGDWIQSEQAQSPDYWVEHLRGTVRFDQGLETLRKSAEGFFLEVGPGAGLSQLARNEGAGLAAEVLPRARERGEEKTCLAHAVACSLLAGVRLDYKNYFQGPPPRRVSLPAYAFQGQDFPLVRDFQGRSGSLETSGAKAQSKRETDPARWYYLPSWKRTPPLRGAQDLEGRSFLIWMDAGGFGESLREELRLRGAAVRVVYSGETRARPEQGVFQLRLSEPSDYEYLVDTLGEEGGLPDRVLYLPGLDPVEDNFQDIYFYAPLYLCRALGEAKLDAPPESLRMVFLTRELHEVLGEEDLDARRALLLGIIRVTPREYPALALLNLDLAALTPDENSKELMELLFRECSKIKWEQNLIAIRGRARFRSAWESQELEAAPREGPALFRRGGVYLITGGTGGIGQTLATYLSEEFEARLVLVSRSSGSPAADKGPKEALYLTGDVCDAKRMGEILKQARAAFGRIDGVIHAAGVPGGGLMQLKDRPIAERVMAAKVQGTLILDELFEGDPPDFMILCSSLSSVMGEFGQVDYCAANNFLDSFAQMRDQRSPGRTLSINWDAWREVGMAVNTPAAPWLKGQSSLAAEKIAKHALLGENLWASEESLLFRRVLHSKEDWILDQHRFQGEGLLPGVAYLEALGAAAAALWPGKVVEIKDVIFVNPLIVSEDESRELYFALEKSDSGYEFVACSRDGDEGFVSHATGGIQAAPDVSPPTFSREVIMERTPRTLNSRKLYEEVREVSPLQLEGRWLNLGELRFGEGEAFAELELPEQFHSELSDYVLYPPLLDMCVGFFRAESRERSHVFLPISYTSLMILGPFTGRMFSHAVFKESDSDETQSADVFIYDESGRPVAQVQGFTAKRVPRGELKSFSRSSARNPALDLQMESLLSRSNSAPPDARDGLRPQEAREAFARMTAAGFTQTLVSTRNLDWVLSEIAKVTRTALAEATAPKAGVRKPRPAIPTPYVAPRNQLEILLAGIQGELLGLEQVGVNDNFFELGGDSLLAVQAIPRARKSDVPLTAELLFKNQTIGELSGALERLESTEKSGVVQAPTEEVALDEELLSAALEEVDLG